MTHGGGPVTKTSCPYGTRESSNRGGNTASDLPEWNLDDLYSGENAPELKADLAWLESECRRLIETHEGRIAELDAKQLCGLIVSYEHLAAKIARMAAYAHLRFAEDTSDPLRGKFVNDCDERLAELTGGLVFIELEIAKLSEERFSTIMSAEDGPARYGSVLDAIRRMRPHQLPAEMEKYIIDRQVSGRGAWTRLFDETISRMRFRFDRTDHTLSQALDKLEDHNRPTRRKAATALARAFGRNQHLFTLITNTLAKDKATDDKWRHFPTPQSARHLNNEVEAEVVEALKEAVVDSYERISHRYYRLKAKWLGLRRLEVWDRNAPLPFESKARIGWTQARATVLEAFSEFSPELAETASLFFSNPWIDAPMRPGKAPGAFSHPTSTEAHPYVLLNYSGRPRDVMVLAHELGHGVHQVLASSQGELLSRTPLTLAETASVFGEMLTFRKLLAAAPTGLERRTLLANKVEDMINTVIRQIAFYDFESRLHERRAEGELTSEEINRIWMEVQGTSLGPAVKFMDGYETFWSYVPHFIHAPFYVYSYAFGHGLVHALYAEYERGQDEFERKYIDLLSAGGSRNYRELLSPFGLEPSKPDFWQKGLGFMEGLIDELEDAST